MLDVTVNCPHCSGLNEIKVDAGEPGDFEYADFECNECEKDFSVEVNYQVRKF